MDEKRTFGEFIKTNKGKIKGTLIIVVGLVVGGIVMKLVAPSTAYEKECLAILEGFADGLSEGAKVLGDATNI